MGRELGELLKRRESSFVFTAHLLGDQNDRGAEEGGEPPSGESADYRKPRAKEKKQEIGKSRENKNFRSRDKNLPGFLKIFSDLNL